MTERRWSRGGLPVTHLLKAPSHRPGFDFTAAMIGLCRDLARRVEPLAAVDMSRVLVTAAIARNRSRYGVQARVTPLRFRHGALTTRRRGALYGLERYHVGDVEMLYLLTFLLPRFLNQSFEEKLATVVHELYHMSPAFDGDLRRFGSRYHTHSKEDYHAGMRELATAYLNVAEPAPMEFLKMSFDDYQHEHGGLRVVVVPRPRMVRIGDRSETPVNIEKLT